MDVQRAQAISIRDLTQLQEPSPRPVQAEGARESSTGRSAAEPTLWELLTREEQEFFRQQLSVGPITYRPNGEAGGIAPLPTGRRIDVRG